MNAVCLSLDEGREGGWVGGKLRNAHTSPFADKDTSKKLSGFTSLCKTPFWCKKATAVAISIANLIYDILLLYTNNQKQKLLHKKQICYLRMNPRRSFDFEKMISEADPLLQYSVNIHNLPGVCPAPIKLST